MKLEKVASNRNNFLEERRSAFGGSDAGSILFGRACPEEKIFKTPLEVIASKISPDVSESEATRAMRVGTHLEPLLLDVFEEETGIRAVQAEHIIRHPKWPFSAANVDGLIVEEIDGVPTVTGIFEAKTCSSSLPESLPFGYQLQLRHYAAVIGTQDQIMLNGRKVQVGLTGMVCMMMQAGKGFPVKLYRMDYDPTQSYELLSYEDAYWRRNILEEDLPSPVSIQDSVLFEKLRKSKGMREPPERIPLSRELEELCRKSEELEEEKKRIDEKRKAVKEKILSVMKDAGSAENEHYRISRKISVRRTFSKDKLFKAYPVLKQREEDFMKESESVLLKIKRKEEKEK